MHARTTSTLQDSAKSVSGQGPILQRQCACGGRAGASGECASCANKRHLQTKLSIGASNDPLEQEADRVADQVLAKSGHARVSASRPHIQRFIGTPGVGREAAAPASVDRVLAGAGRPLDSGVLSDMGQRFGHDFSRVRVHTGGVAAQSARDMNAHAYTVGRDIVFGSGQYAPETHTGRRMLAHELTHVVQQGSGLPWRIQRAPADCATKKRPDVDSDVQDKVDAAAKDPEALPDLYLALKRARACFSDFDEAAFLGLVAEGTAIYSAAQRKSTGIGHGRAIKKDDRRLAWAESLKPLAGYLVSGFDTANRFLSGANKRKLGLTEAPSHKPFRQFADKQNESTKRADAQQAFSESNVLVFSGHQYAQYKLPGVWNTGNWDVTLDVRGITGPLNNIKLLISTSCATLCKEAYEVWKSIFPSAVFLGAARSTPLKGSILANAFINNLPKDLLFDPGAPGLSSAISTWKSAVQKTQSSAVRGGVLDIAAGTVEFWNGKKWESKSATDPDNQCKVKDDYSAGVPDPRGP